MDYNNFVEKNKEIIQVYQEIKPLFNKVFEGQDSGFLDEYNYRAERMLKVTEETFNLDKRTKKEVYFQLWLDKTTNDLVYLQQLLENIRSVSNTRNII